MSAAILVIGATGTTGRELAKLLAKGNHKTRATVRSTSNKRELQALEVELVQAQLNDVGSLENAMDGIQKVYFATPLVPNMAELSSSIITAAKSAGVKHLGKLAGGGIGWRGGRKCPMRTRRRPDLLLRPPDHPHQQQQAPAQSAAA